MPDLAAPAGPVCVYLCASGDLLESGRAVNFELLYGGQEQAAFAVRYAGTVHAYLNRCAHVPMEMDYQPGQFFDLTGHWLICATHGALYSPQSGQCRGGPCRGGLVKIGVSEAEGSVYWHTSGLIQRLPVPNDRTSE